MRRRTLTAFVAALAAAGAWSVGCGGGGGGGGGTQPPPPAIVFAPASFAGANSVSLNDDGSGGATTLTLQVVVQQIADLYGVAFDLDYPATALRFLDAAQGSVLAAGGAPVSLQAAETIKGHLVVGISRLGNVSGLTSATGIVLTLRFEATTAGSGAFSFSRAAAYDSLGTPIAAVRWVAGTVTVVR